MKIASTDEFLNQGNLKRTEDRPEDSSASFDSNRLDVKCKFRVFYISINFLVHFLRTNLFLLLSVSIDISSRSEPEKVESVVEKADENENVEEAAISQASLVEDVECENDEEEKEREVEADNEVAEVIERAASEVYKCI